MDITDVLALAKLAAARLGLRIVDTALILDNMNRKIGTTTVLYNEDFILWIDKHYIAYGLNDKPDVFYLMTDKEHISEELRTVIKIMKTDKSLHQLRTLQSIKEQLETAQTAIKLSGADFFMFAEIPNDDMEESNVNCNSKNQNMVMTLCHKCVRDYYNSPDHSVKAVFPRGDKESCTKCNGKGYDYIVKSRKD